LVTNWKEGLVLVTDLIVYFFLLPFIYILRPIKGTTSIDMPRKKPTAQNTAPRHHANL
jgi:hypothetical protein